MRRCSGQPAKKGHKAQSRQTGDQVDCLRVGHAPATHAAIVGEKEIRNRNRVLSGQPPRFRFWALPAHVGSFRVPRNTGVIRFLIGYKGFEMVPQIGQP